MRQNLKAIISGIAPAMVIAGGIKAAIAVGDADATTTQPSTQPATVPATHPTVPPLPVIPRMSGIRQ